MKTPKEALSAKAKSQKIKQKRFHERCQKIAQHKLEDYKI